MRSLGATLGATRANDFTRRPYEFGLATGDHARSRTDPDEAEHDTGIYGLERWPTEEQLLRRFLLERVQPYPIRFVNWFMSK